MLAVRRLQLTAFRNHSQLNLDCHVGPVALTGSNGAGKTNLLEAISFLGPGRGLRRATMGDIDHHPANSKPAFSRPWAVMAVLETETGALMIGTGRDQNSDKRRVRIDGVAVRSQGALAERIRLIWLTPQMDRLFQEGSSGRRRFFDRLVFGLDPAHASRVSAYEHAMRERSRLLRGGMPCDPIWLSRLERRMAEKGIAIAVARRIFLEQLRFYVKSAEPGLFPVPILELRGQVEQWLEEGMAQEEGEERLHTELAAKRGLDAAIGGTKIGPHRSDFCVLHAASGQMAADCSTGEQKGLLISLILAHASLQMEQNKVAPLLLLDEIMAHLDTKRRYALADAICALRVQAWMTGTEFQLFEAFGKRVQNFQISAGQAVLHPQRSTTAGLDS